MPEYSDTIEDFNIKWAHTYALWKGDLINVVGAFFEETDDESPRVYVRYIKNGKNYNEFDFDFTSVTPLLFDAKFFNGIDLDEESCIKKKITACMYVARSSRRQNKRSMCGDNTHVTSPIHPVIAMHRGGWPEFYGLSESLVERMRANVYPSYLDALDLCHKHLAIAISPNFAVSLSNLSATKYLFLSLFGFVGECDRDTIYVKHANSRQEINDFVNRHGLNLRVIDAR